MILSGLDIGTTGCKLTSYDEKGNFVYSAYRAYEIKRESEGHEFDATLIFSAVCEVIRETAEKHPLSAIGVTSFGESFVVLDENDAPLFPVMLYTDPRGDAECRHITEAVGEEKIIRTAGVMPHSMYSLPKIMYLKENEPAFARARHVLLIQDYIVYMLTGKALIDYSLAARSMALDIRNKCWSGEILDAAGICASLLSSPVPTGTVAGNVKDALKDTLGLKDEVAVVVGAHDQVASALGAGALSVGDAVDGSGTVECITPIFDKIPEDRAFYQKGYCAVPYLEEGSYVSYAFSFTGGAAIKWFKDRFCAEMSYAALDGGIPDEPTGILALPHFAGAATPFMDSGATAALVGLTLAHESKDIYKSLLEGVAYEMRYNLDELAAFGICPKRMYATGGGASSNAWLAVKADVIGIPLTALSAKEVGAMGTCMLVGRAIGCFTTLEEAKAVFVAQRATVSPCEKKHVRYTDLYGGYRQLYSALRPITKKAYGK